MYLSEFIDKRLISLKSASDEGKVIGAYLHKDKLTVRHLITESGKAYSLEDIFEVGEVITTTGREQTLIKEEYHEISLSQEIILVNGKSLGRVKDVRISRENKGEELIGELGKIKVKTIVATSRNIITANPTYRKLDKGVSLPVSKVLKLNEPKAKDGNPSQKEVITPSSYDFLIGKKVSSEVSDISRSFVLMAGTLITERVIENARRAGKLSELVTRSK